MGRQPTALIALATSPVPRSTPPVSSEGSTCRTVGVALALSTDDVVLSVSVFMLSVGQDMAPFEPSILSRPGGVTIAYYHREGKLPGVIFCTGFKSDMSGGKALALEEWCEREGRQFTRFDYQGHGASSGRFEDGTIGKWRDDALAILDKVTIGRQIVVGSSMGGWIACLMAIARKERIAAIVGIAPAIDFTQKLLWPRLDAAARRQIEEEGVWYRPSAYGDGPYPITKKLIDEGKKHLLLPGPIPFSGPVRIIHGMRDDAVPWEHSLRLAEAMMSTDIEIILVKDGEHRLSRDSDLSRLIATVSEQADTREGR